MDAPPGVFEHVASMELKPGRSKMLNGAGGAGKAPVPTTNITTSWIAFPMINVTPKSSQPTRPEAFTGNAASLKKVVRYAYQLHCAGDTPIHFTPSVSPSTAAGR